MKLAVLKPDPTINFPKDITTHSFVVAQEDLKIKSGLSLVTVPLVIKPLFAAQLNGAFVDFTDIGTGPMLVKGAYDGTRKSVDLLFYGQQDYTFKAGEDVVAFKILEGMFIRSAGEGANYPENPDSSTQAKPKKKRRS